MVSGISNYNEWIASLNGRGIKTTSLGKNEANFANYANALSDSLKQEIMASFDTDADYDLQSKLASLLGGKNLIQSTDMKSTLAGSGISYSVQYVQTSYIVDNKKGGKYANNTNATNGAIAVYTFKDANGGEIKIADANGNGALESEELFMNEILSGVVSDISASSGGGAAGSGAGGAAAVQNNNDEQLRLLMAQLDAQLQEQREFFEQQMQNTTPLQTTTAEEPEEDEAEVEKPEDKDVEETKSKDENDKDEIDEDDVRSEAKSLINRMDIELSTNELSGILDDIVDLVVNHGADVEDAVKEIIEDFQEDAA